MNKILSFFNKRNAVYLLTFFLLFFILWFFVWMYKNFGRTNLDEIAIILQIGLQGTDAGMFWSFIKKVILRSLMWGVIATVFYNLVYKYRVLRILSFVVVFALIIYNGYKANIQLGSLFSSTTSNFYEKEYVDPKNAKISFPTKRNVLVIVLESMEKTYADKNIFPQQNLIPNITKLEQDNVSFNNYKSISGLSHTIAAITGITTGLPLFYTSYKNIEKMLGTTGIGTVFKQNGYSTWALFPASGEFSLKTRFLSRMGFDTIYDGEKFRELLPYELDEYPFEGVDDGSLFELSKPIIKDIVRTSGPYFIMMETINTHCHGYFTQACRELNFPQETMEDIIMCEDQLVYNFVKWFRQIDPTAVVILVNDHLQHTGLIMEKLSDASERTLNNVFINTDIFKYNISKRKISALDFFPTIIESAGGKIKNCRLGLGTSLSKRCRRTKTLLERFTDTVLEDKLEQSNDLYYKLMTGTEK